MEITIHDQRKIYSIQKDLNEALPFIRLEFFSKSKRPGRSSVQLMKHISKTIGECRTVHAPGNLSIHPQMTVNEVEQKFGNVYGLLVHVFRKAGDMWQETSETANWTLEKQNELGREQL